MRNLENSILERFDEVSDKTPSENTARRIAYVAFSGGADSSALLYVLQRHREQLSYDLRVAHINHGLHPDSYRWQQQCEDVANRYELGFLGKQLTPPDKDSIGNIEDWARRERYKWLASLMKGGDLVVTAHHIDDQLETVLFRLLRGAGAHGLGAMRECVPFSNGYLFRPMLRNSRDEIEQFVEKKQLHYLKDPSNQDTQLDRNYLRHEIINKIKVRWPDAARRVAHAALIQQQVSQSIEQRGEQILALTLTATKSVPVTEFTKLTNLDRYAVIRQWCIEQQLSLPGYRQITIINKRLNDGLSPLDLNWGNARMREYRGELFLFLAGQRFDPGTTLTWDLRSCLQLPHGELRAMEGCRNGMKPAYLDSVATVGFYQRQGERCHPALRGHSQKLKKLFQEWGVPPWQRSEIPLIWINGAIAAVVPYCVTKRFSVAGDKLGIGFRFSRTNEVLGRILE